MKSAVIILVFSFINYSLCCKGCVDLDELTFGKVIKKFRTVIVKLDQKFPYGETHEAFASLADAINNKTVSGVDHPEVLVATVGILDYGEFDNKALGEKYGQSKRQDLPLIRIFNDGDLENPIALEIGKEHVTVTQLFLFLKAHSKVHVQVPGCMKELDELADAFVNEPKRRKEILTESENFIEKIARAEKQKQMKFYVAVMKGVIEKGDDFISKQRERMTNLLKEKLSEKKIEELNNKLNILASFRLQPAAKNDEL